MYNVNLDSVIIILFSIGINKCFLITNNNCDFLQNSSMNVIQQEWFKVSSHKLSICDQVEDYLTGFSEFSKELLQQIINMSDANVSLSVYMVQQIVYDMLKIVHVLTYETQPVYANFCLLVYINVCLCYVC